ncbi:unannotated protein [freshwater metagenome]|uniref:Unannotated protein n=1 Tax=freshwater metagenome TaxID=449393 RepID=A0A6J7F3T7_9ZZZZ
MIGGTGRIEDVDETLERHVGVVERRQVRGTGPAEQLGEREIGCYLGAQNQSPDEHADQIVERRVATPGDGRADCDVLGPAEASHEDRPCCMHGHEHGRVVRAGEVHQAGVDVWLDLEPNTVAAHRLPCRARMVERKRQQLG